MFAQPISVSPGSISSLGNVCAGASPFIARLDVRSNTPGPKYSVFKDPNPANLFFEVAPSSGLVSTPGSGGDPITVTITLAGLRQGNQRSYLIVRRQGSPDVRVPIDVQCFPPPAFSLQTRDVSVEIPPGGTKDITVNVQRNTSASSGVLTLSTRPRSAYITKAVIPGSPLPSGTNTAQMTVTVSAVGLADGFTDDAYVDVVDSAVSIDSLRISLSVKAPPFSLLTPLAPVRLDAMESTSDPSPKGLNIDTNPSGVAVTITPKTFSGGAWLLVNGSGFPMTATTPFNIGIGANARGLKAGLYRGSIDIAPAGQPVSTVDVELVVTGAGVTINSVKNGASFGPVLAPGSWATVFGSNLAPDTATEKRWDGSISSGQLPTALDRVQVTIDGKPAPVSFVKSGQVNFLVPANTSLGSNVPVIVQNSAGVSPAASITVQQYVPALFVVGGTQYAVAQHHPDYAYVGPVGIVPSGNFRPAIPGEILLFYGSGFGPTQPEMNTSSVVTTPSRVTANVTMTIGGVPAPVQAAYLIQAGVYQLNVVVPALPAGDHLVVATVSGVQSQSNVSVNVRP